MPWPAVVFGWPFVGVSMLGFALGLATRRPWLMALGAVLAVPFCLYLSATPRFGAFGLMALFLNAGAAWASARGRSLLALILLVPFVGLAAFVAWLVFTQ